jgi:hypothetical protein
MRLPPETVKLITTGVLKPENQTQPVMKCGKCGAPMTLVWLHAVMTKEEVHTAKTIPGTAWGKDVAPICPCCSFAGMQAHGYQRGYHKESAQRIP